MDIKPGSHVMIVVPYLKVGGQERQLYYLSKELESRGHSTTVVACERIGRFISVYEQERVQVTYLDIPFVKKNTHLLIWRLAKLIRAAKPEVVISRSWNTNLLVSLAGAVTGAKTIHYITGSNYHTRNYGIIKREFARLVMKQAKRIVCVSEGTRESFQAAFRMDSSKVCVIYNGVDTNSVSLLSMEHEGHVVKADSNDIHLSFVGRLEPRKGLDVLLSALSIIKRDVPDLWARISLTVVGGGAQEPYENMCTDLGLDGSVHFVGEQPNPYGYMSESDVFILPSRSEGFPNVLLEAMALGLPSIASDCWSGPSEIIKHKVNGWLVSPEDAHELAKAIMELSRNKRLCHDLGERARDSIRANFPIESKVREVSELIAAVSQEP